MAGYWSGSSYYGDDTSEKVDGYGDDNDIEGAGGNDTLKGAGGDDDIEGEAGSDVLDGGAGDDRLEGDDRYFEGPDNDRLTGGAGSDTLIGGAGRDTLDGGDGDDRIEFFPFGDDDKLDRTLDVLAGGAGEDTLAMAISEVIGGQTVTVKLGATTQVKIGSVTVARATSFERLDLELGSDQAYYPAIGTGRYAVTGGALADRVIGGTGNDTLIGLGGDDTLGAAEGSDSVLGGAGDDDVTLAAGGKDRVSLSTGNDELTLTRWTSAAPAAGIGAYDGGAGTDRLVIGLYGVEQTGLVFDGANLKIGSRVVAQTKGFESVEIRDGPSNSYRFTGTGGDDLAVGSSFGKDDLLSGGDGDDTLEGGEGDTLRGGDGDDSLSTGLNAELSVVDGGAGFDRVRLVATRSDLPIVMSGDLQKGATVKSGGNTVGTLKGIEAVDVIDSAGGDSLLGAGAADTFRAGRGADTVRAGAGDDLFAHRFEDVLLDQIDLGAGGLDTFEIQSASDEAIVMSGAIGALSITKGGVKAATVKGAERIVAETGAGDDRLAGGAFSDDLAAGKGANTLIGGAGGDLLSVVGDLLRDSVDGGAGDDALSFTGESGIFGPEPLDLAIIAKATGGVNLTISSGGKVIVQAKSVESATIYGGIEDDRIEGLSGDDELRGDDGGDTLSGGAGDDLLIGGDGSDAIIGGAGFDTASFAGVSSAVVVTLISGRTVTATDGSGFETDQLTGIENLVGGFGRDRLTGDAKANVINGDSGDDTLDGGAGIDTVDFTGVDGVEIVLKGAAFSQVVSDFYVDAFRNFENVIGSGGADTIVGDGGANRIQGGRGGDVLTGGKGADVFVYTTAEDTSEPGTGSIYDPARVLAPDVITDFSQAQGDMIDFAAIDADPSRAGDQGFVFLGKAAFTGAGGQLRAVTGGGRTTLFADIDGDKVADLAIAFDQAIAFAKDDFAL